MIQLRLYQNRVDLAQQKFMKDSTEYRAIVCSCTGNGKTINFLKLISEQVLLGKTVNRCLKELITQPRLALSNEQQVRAHQLFCRFNLTYEFSSFHTVSIIEWQNQKQKVPKAPLGVQLA